VRIALLGAMAALGMPQFRPEFEANLSSDSPELLLRAIQGIAVIGNGDLVDRLSALTAHNDVRVRQRALEALGALGSEDQLPTIVARLNPSVEAIEGPRQAAWQAFLQICKKLPLSKQIAVVDRLVDFPTLAADYLKRLQDEMASTKPAPKELPEVREKLATIYDSLDRHCEALPYWRQLYTAAVYAADPRMHELALAQLRSALECDKTDRIESDMLALKDADESIKDAAVKAVMEYLDKHADAQETARRDAVVAALRTLPPDAFPALTYLLSSEKFNPKPAPQTQPTDTD
jgi:HEAT repeat protein